MAARSRVTGPLSISDSCPSAESMLVVIVQRNASAGEFSHSPRLQLSCLKTQDEPSRRPVIRRGWEWESVPLT